MTLAFEWDPDKAAANLAKHRVSFQEAVTGFADPHGVLVDDPPDTHGETRFALLGYSSLGRVLVFMFTERGNRIRLISARKATLRER